MLLGLIGWFGYLVTRAEFKNAAPPAPDRAVEERLLFAALRERPFVRDLYISPGHLNIGVLRREKEWSSPMIATWACSAMLRYRPDLTWVRFVDVEQIAAGKSPHGAEIVTHRCSG